MDVILVDIGRDFYQPFRAAAERFQRLSPQLRSRDTRQDRRTDVAQSECAEIVAWWKPRLHSIPLADDEALAAVRDAVDTAVGAAVRNNMSTIAAQLSGGHDSTMVVEAAQRLKAPDQRLIAITGGALEANDELPNGFFDDTALAERTATFLGIDHVVARTAPESVLAVADRLACADEPLFNPYNLAWFEHTCALAAKAGADVLLTGQSGNLVISPYGLDRLSILARQARLPTLLREWSAYRKRHGASRRGLLAMTLGPWMPEKLWAWAAARRGRRHPAPHESALVRLENRSVRDALVHARRTGQARAGTPLRQVGSAARLRIMSWADNGLFNHYIRARHGIEIRDPLGSKRLVELSLMLAPDHFYRGGEVRRLSINLLRGRVPDAVIAERRRGAQGTNWGASASLALDEMKQEIALIEADRELSDLFDVPKLKKMLDQWPVSRWGDFDVDTTYRASATVALCAARFARRVRERDCGQKAL